MITLLPISLDIRLMKIHGEQSERIWGLRSRDNYNFPYSWLQGKRNLQKVIDTGHLSQHFLLMIFVEEYS